MTAEILRPFVPMPLDIHRRLQDVAPSMRFSHGWCLGVLRYFAGRQNHCWPTVADIAAIMGKSAATTRRIIQACASLGYIRVEERADSRGRRLSNAYHFLEKFLALFPVRGKRAELPVQPAQMPRQVPRPPRQPQPQRPAVEKSVENPVGIECAPPSSLQGGTPTAERAYIEQDLRELDSKLESSRELLPQTQAFIDGLRSQEVRRWRTPLVSRNEQADHNCETYVVREWKGERQMRAIEILADRAHPGRKTLLIEITREIKAAGWRLPSMEAA